MQTENETLSTKETVESTDLSGVNETIDQEENIEAKPEDNSSIENGKIESQEHAPEETEDLATEEEEWTPSFKYKVKDDEFDMEEWVKPLVTNKEIEEKLKVLHSKGHGIEDIKKDRTTLRETKQQLEEKLTTTESELNNMKQSLNIVSDWVQKGEMDKFFDALQIPEDKVLQYAIERLKYREMSPEQRAQIDAQKTQQRQLEEAQWQNQQLQLPKPRPASFHSTRVQSRMLIPSLARS